MIDFVLILAGAVIGVVAGCIIAQIISLRRRVKAFEGRLRTLDLAYEYANVQLHNLGCSKYQEEEGSQNAKSP